MFHLDVQRPVTPTQSKLRNFHNRLKPLIQNRDEIRNGRLISDSPHKQQILKLVTQFEEILNVYVDNFLVLTEKEAKIAETALEVELTAYAVIRQLFQDLYVQRGETKKLANEVIQADTELKTLRDQRVHM